MRVPTCWRACRSERRFQRTGARHDAHCDFAFPGIQARHLAGLLATGGESYLLAAFPIYFTGGAWWVAYTAAGLALPLLAYAVWVRLKKAVRRG